MPQLNFAVSALVAATVLAACASYDADHRRGRQVTWMPEAPQPAASVPPAAAVAGATATVMLPSGASVLAAAMDFGALTGWAADDHAAALHAFQVGCAKVKRWPEGRPIGGAFGAAGPWKAVCRASERVAVGDERRFFEENFVPVRLDPAGSALVTGYFEPILPATRRPSAQFRHPIYKRPPEVARIGAEYGRQSASGGLSPFYTRAEIDAGALEGRGLEIAYLDDAVDAFFLHIQGSGRLEIADEGGVRVGFAAKNGREYRSVGQAMIAQGLARNGASAEAIREFYLADPARGRKLLAENPSYIFFRELTDLDPASGPIGALGVQLVASRSVAVDRAYVPLGAPVWLDTTSPTGPLRLLTMAHDTGSAIKGPQRIDYFWGTGAVAGKVAGQMKNPGSATMLAPRTAVAEVLTPGL